MPRGLRGDEPSGYSPAQDRVRRRVAGAGELSCCWIEARWGTEELLSSGSNMRGAGWAIGENNGGRWVDRERSRGGFGRWRRVMGQGSYILGFD